MTKSITIKAPKTKLHESAKSEDTTKIKGVVYEKTAIKDALVDYTSINTVKKRQLLVPGKTYIRYINRDDSGLRIGGFLKQITDEYVTLTSRGRSWILKLTNVKLYAKLSVMYENMEKASVYDFIKELHESGKLKVQMKNDKSRFANVSWDELLNEYYKH